MLNPYDVVGVSFWVATVYMAITTVFLLVERQSVAVQWRLPMTITFLMMLLSSVYYCHMKMIWVCQQGMALPFRYLEWMFALPLQMLALYFTLQVGSRRDLGLLAQLVIIPSVMLWLGFFMELDVISGWWGLVPMTLGWGYILYLLWAGKASKVRLAMVNLCGRSAYQWLVWIITVGWLVYPVSYYLGTFRVLDMETMNLLLNIGDTFNKVLWSLVIWHAAYKDSGLLHAE